MNNIIYSLTREDEMLVMEIEKRVLALESALKQASIETGVGERHLKEIAVNYFGVLGPNSRVNVLTKAINSERARKSGLAKLDVLEKAALGLFTDETNI